MSRNTSTNSRREIYAWVAPRSAAPAVKSRLASKTPSTTALTESLTLNCAVELVPINRLARRSGNGIPWVAMSCCPSR
ncbi:hypothetical protein D9M71_224240 [compost metagenome]